MKKFVLFVEVVRCEKLLFSYDLCYFFFTYIIIYYSNDAEFLMHCCSKHTVVLFLSWPPKHYSIIIISLCVCGVN